MKKTYLSLPYNKERDERIYPLTWIESHIGVKINCRGENKEKLWLFLWGYHNLKMLICKSKYLKINIYTFTKQILRIIWIMCKNALWLHMSWQQYTVHEIDPEVFFICIKTS